MVVFSFAFGRRLCFGCVVVRDVFWFGGTVSCNADVYAKGNYMIKCIFHEFFRVFSFVFYLRFVPRLRVFVCVYFHCLCLVRLQVYDLDLAIFCCFPWFLVPLCGPFRLYVTLLSTFVLLLCDLSPTVYLYQILFVCKYIIDTREKLFS
jgi:hypothetical protein